MTDVSIAGAVDQPAAEPSRALVWNWPSLLVVQRSSGSDSPDALVRPVLLSPNQGGLDLLGNLDEVRSIWIVQITQEGQLRSESVGHLCLWRLSPDQDGAFVTALLCESGAIFIVSDDMVYEVDEVTRKWFAGGHFSSARRLQDAFTVNAVVVAKRNEHDQVTVRSDEGLQYSISRQTTGVRLEDLEDGMRVQCFVSRLQRVLSASVRKNIVCATESRPSTE